MTPEEYNVLVRTKIKALVNDVIMQGAKNGITSDNVLCSIVSNMIDAATVFASSSFDKEGTKLFTFGILNDCIEEHYNSK